MAKYKLAEYRVYLMNSIISGKNRHILVEGKDDKYLIKRLCHDFLSNNSQINFDKILVDSAEDLTEDNQLTSSFGNRDKVEFIASSIIDKPYANGFVGFIDRELDGFEWDYESSEDLQDFISSHQVLSRLILSRGHSIENYIFEFSILSEVLKIVSTTIYTNQAIELFKENFEAVLRIACSLGLAATKAQILSKTKSSIDWKLIEIISPTEINFKLDDWITKLSSRGIEQEQIENLKLHYTIYTEQISRTSISLVRWICHGHIGYSFLTALYERCIFEVCPNQQEPNKELSRITWATKELFYIFINCWIGKISENKYEYPTAIFELLGITQND